jgi:hypothetical protein
LISLKRWKSTWSYVKNKKKLSSESKRKIPNVRENKGNENALINILVILNS